MNRPSFPDAAPLAPAEGRAAAEASTFRNFIVLASHQVTLRIGWIFKTESIVMPAFLDAVGGTPVMRGLLPVLNRIGFSLPPVLFAGPLGQMPKKKWALAGCSLAMAGPFALLALMWALQFRTTATLDELPGWWPWMFLVAYGGFFVLTGMNQLAGHTLQGKLIPANLRGRLMTTGIVCGAPLAMLAAYLLLPAWLAPHVPRFDGIFAMTSFMFVVAALTSTALIEHADTPPTTRPKSHQQLRAAWITIYLDHRFRKAAAVAFTFGFVLALFPHYQALGREKLHLDLSNLMLWVVVQNAGTMACSLLVGPLADKAGNRMALHVTVLGSAITPLLALAFAYLPITFGQSWYWLIYPTLGLTPVTIRLLNHFVLELAPPADHPRYVSTLGICLALPVLVGGPLAGWCIEKLGFEPVFATGALIIGLGGALTYWLDEPRHGVQVDWRSEDELTGPA